jgi:hypothetical protein
MTHPRSAGTMEFRPSRRSLWWLIPAEVVVPVLVGLAFLRERPVLMLVMVTAFIALNMGVTLVMKVYARTVIEPDGLRVRAIGERLFPWSEVRDADVVATATGGVVRVTMTNGFVLALFAPRDGLLRKDPRIGDAVAVIRSWIAADRAAQPRPAD